MILFPEYQYLSGKDDTLDPYYFAKKPILGNASGLSTNEIKEIIKGLIEENPDWVTGGASQTQVDDISNQITNINTQITSLGSSVTNLGNSFSSSQTSVNNTFTLFNNRITELENKKVHKELTKAQYNALSNEEKMADIEYFVSD